MPGAPAFFVPAATPEEQEGVYGDMAGICGRAVPEADRRIYSITYVHDGTEWTATVGERLRGIRRWTTRSRGKKIDHQQPTSDPATVLAIFPGNPYMVLTNHGLGGHSVGSAWVNPFMAGRPKGVTYFNE